jgi:hypothetical protein
MKIILSSRKTEYSDNQKPYIDGQKIRVITKLPNSEQSYKGKVKTHCGGYLGGRARLPDTILEGPFNDYSIKVWF